MRRLVRETRLDPAQFILPLFAVEGDGIRREIGSMPGTYQLSVDELVKECEKTQALGVGGVILFGIPTHKDECASGAYDDNGIVQQSIRAIKRAVPKLLVMTDVCNCEYTSHGHCGKIVDGDVDNDATLEWLAKSAVSHARAGADVVAPSDMMDGRVGAIRDALDEAGFEKTPILSYAAKYASCFYGPFRDAAESAPQFGDRRGYQMDPPNARPGRGRGHDYGETRDALPGHYPDGARQLRRAARGLPGVGRVQHDHGGGAQWLDRSRPGNPRIADLYPARGRRLHSHLFFSGRREAPRLAAPAGATAIPFKGRFHAKNE
jgi:delta-aminolevulinic acid dehydratase/porphobilinogen synthase